MKYIRKANNKTVKESTANSIVPPCCEKPGMKSDTQTCKRVTNTPFTTKWTFYNKPDCFMEYLLWPTQLNFRSFAICVHLIRLPLNDQIRDFRVELQAPLTMSRHLEFFFFPNESWPPFTSLQDMSDIFFLLAFLFFCCWKLNIECWKTVWFWTMKQAYLIISQMVALPVECIGLFS